MNDRLPRSPLPDPLPDSILESTDLLCGIQARVTSIQTQLGSAKDLYRETGEGESPVYFNWRRRAKYALQAALDEQRLVKNHLRHLHAEEHERYAVTHYEGAQNGLIVSNS